MDCVQATALALGVELEVVTERDELRARWAEAPLKLVGWDLASRLGGLTGESGRTYVVGPGDATLLGASAELRAPALALPAATPQLAEVLTNHVEEESTARVVALVGASGGLGVSSLSVALAVAAVRAGSRTALVELAACGGGLDLLVGAETKPGSRWGELAGASGQVGDLGEHLLTASGVSVLSLSRDGALPPPAASSAVLSSLCRTHRVVVVDAGAGDVVASLGRRVRPVLVVGADVRSVASARQRATRLPLGSASLVVRLGQGRNLPPGAVGEALGLPLLGVLRPDADVPRIAAAGGTVAAARRLAADARTLWKGLRA